jgi:hypothetical protein
MVGIALRSNLMMRLAPLFWLCVAVAVADGNTTNATTASVALANARGDGNGNGNAGNDGNDGSGGWLWPQGSIVSGMMPDTRPKAPALLPHVLLSPDDLRYFAESLGGTRDAIAATQHQNLHVNSRRRVVRSHTSPPLLVAFHQPVRAQTCVAPLLTFSFCTR